MNFGMSVPRAKAISTRRRWLTANRSSRRPSCQSGPSSVVKSVNLTFLTVLDGQSMLHWGMPAPSNPFAPAPGATPPALVGREAELVAIDDALDRAERRSQPTPMAFVGLRGLGKTVLLHRIAHDSAKTALHLAVEAEPGATLAASFREAMHLLRERDKPLRIRLGDALDAALRHIPLPSYDLPGEMGSVSLRKPESDAHPEEAPLGRALMTFNRAAHDIHKFLAITIDEVQDADIASLRTVIARVNQTAGTNQPILFACAGLPQSREILRKLRTYTTRWDIFDLEFLTRAECVEAIRGPLDTARVAIDDRAIDLLAQEAAGYPFFVQKYASAVWNKHRGSKITYEDVIATVPGVRRLVEKTLYGSAFSGLTPREIVVALALAELGPGAHAIGVLARSLGTTSDALGSIRTNLIKKDILFVPAAGSIQFRMPLADRYVLEHRNTLEAPEVVAYRNALTAPKRDLGLSR